MAKLTQAVFVKDPDRNATVLLLPGEEPEPRLAALVTNPDAWEGGKLPTTAKKTATTSTSSSDNDGDDSGGGDRTAARKTAARKPARGRNAADEGSGGE